MQIEQKQWTAEKGWVSLTEGALPASPQLVFVFGGAQKIKDKASYAELKAMYPSSHILMCSTAGEIIGTSVNDNSLAVSAVYFEKTKIALAQTETSGAEESYSRGRRLAENLSQDGLKHVMVFSDGINVNGTDLVRGLTEILSDEISVTGGLVGDGANFKETYLGLDAVPQQNQIVLIGFYGDSIKVGYGSLGGWDTFGLERTITKSEKNVLFELDDRPALELYKEYLGDQAEGLPGTGLLFPLSVTIKTDEGEANVVRTILAVDEDRQSLTFAGDLPEGSRAILMKANFDRLVDGASGAASMSVENWAEMKPDFALLISCVGRKLVLADRVEEEVEAVAETLGTNAKLAGFYSYGEISPVAATEKQCQLHNQTMTITTFKEV